VSVRETDVNKNKLNIQRVLTLIPCVQLSARDHSVPIAVVVPCKALTEHWDRGFEFRPRF